MQNGVCEIDIYYFLILRPFILILLSFQSIMLHFISTATFVNMPPNSKVLYFLMYIRFGLFDSPRAVFTHGPKGPGPRAANFQGRHIKKNRD
jgi:hypothetical protein